MTKLKDLTDLIKQKIMPVKGFESFYNAGVDYFARQEYEKAINFFKQALEQPNVKPQVYYNLALSYQHIKDYEKAIATYNKFLELNPKDYDGLYNLALVYFKKENYPKAIEFFERCVELKEDLDSLKSLILAYLSNGETQKAVEFADKIYESSDKGKDLYYEMAKVFENKHSMNKDFTFIDIAIDMYSKIAKKAPDFFDAYLSTSICYAKKGEWEKSVDFCSKAIEANPKSYEANNQMGLVYYCRNEIKEAIKYYEQALKLKPDGDFKVYSNLGYAYEKIGQIDKAIKIFTQLVSKFQQFPAKDEIKNHLRVLKTMEG